MSAVAPNASSKPSVTRRRLFPRRVRLLKHVDFERVYKQGQRHFAAHITVFYLARPEGDGLRVGFTVGRVLGGAVDRNRMKRQLREAVRLHFPEKPAPVDVVINPKKSMLGIEFAMLKKEVSRAFDVIQKFAGKLPPAAGQAT